MNIRNKYFIVLTESKYSIDGKDSYRIFVQHKNKTYGGIKFDTSYNPVDKNQVFYKEEDAVKELRKFYKGKIKIVDFYKNNISIKEV